MTKLLQRLPYFLSHFLGYRKPDHVAKVLPKWRVYSWTFIAAWIGIALLEIIFTYASSFQSRHTPMIIASFVRSNSNNLFLFFLVTNKLFLGSKCGFDLWCSGISISTTS